MSDEATFDPAERAKQKQASRDKDAEDLASGLKSTEDLRKENGKFAFPDAVVDLLGCKRPY